VKNQQRKKIPCVVGTMRMPKKVNIETNNVLRIQRRIVCENERMASECAEILKTNTPPQCFLANHP